MSIEQSFEVFDKYGERYGLQRAKADAGRSQVKETDIRHQELKARTKRLNELVARLARRELRLRAHGDKQGGSFASILQTESSQTQGRRRQVSPQPLRPKGQRLLHHRRGHDPAGRRCLPSPRRASRWRSARGASRTFHPRRTCTRPWHHHEVPAPPLHGYHGWTNKGREATSKFTYPITDETIAAACKASDEARGRAHNKRSRDDWQG